MRAESGQCREWSVKLLLGCDSPSVHTKKPRLCGTFWCLNQFKLLLFGNSDFPDDPLIRVHLPE